MFWWYHQQRFHARTEERKETFLLLGLLFELGAIRRTTMNPKSRHPSSIFAFDLVDLFSNSKLPC